MELSRRQFVILTSALACGCQSTGGPAVAPVPREVDAGPVAQFQSPGVYDKFKSEGFFVVRNQDRLFALSAICTHRQCPIDTAPGQSYRCKCHGSTFDPSGKVTKGPASQDLPTFATTIDSRSHLIVHVGTPASPVALGMIR